MPEPEFKGRRRVCARRLSVPYRPFVHDAAKSVVADAAYARAVNNINVWGGG